MNTIIICLIIIFILIVNWFASELREYFDNWINKLLI